MPLRAGTGGSIGMTIRNLDALLQPGRVALVGASERPGSVGAMIAHNLVTSGFSGHVHLVNPKRDLIANHPCFPSITALPGIPDLVVVATPPASVPGVVAEAAAKGIRAAAVITAGLDGPTKQRMLDAGRSKLMRVLGPNILGLLLPQIGLNASFSHCAALPGDLAFVSQSGALITAVLDWAGARRIGFSHVVSLGDMADVDFGDMLDYLAGDTQSRAILLYIEAVTHAAKFVSAARRAARVKPVIAIKAGRNAAAARAAASHTGRLAGSDQAYEAAFRRAGVLRVTALEELFEAAEMLARTPRIAGERLLILTNGGGAGVLAADHLGDENGCLAQLSAATLAALDQKLPANWSRANPVDVIGDAGPDRYADALAIALTDPDCDAVLAINCPTALASSTDIARRVISTWRGIKPGKPLITNWLGETVAQEARGLFSAAGVPTFETPGAAVRGFMQVVRYDRAQDELLRTPPAMPRDKAPDCAAVDQIVAAALAADRTMLSEHEGKAMLEAYGIPVAPTRKAASPAEAAQVAGEMITRHGSVVLKILSDDISHKSDVGGVVLDLKGEVAVREAAEAMLARVEATLPAARIDGFTLSAMIRRPRAHELIAGVSVDATFGPLIMFGAGGTAVEVLADTSLALPPLDIKLARDLVARTRVARLLAGYRDRKPADLDAVAAALVKLSALVCRHREIREIDINPLFADEAGVIALDARVRIADERREPRTAMAVKPYPEAWEKAIDMPALGRVMLRPIRPEDEVLYEAFLARVTPEDLRMRLFAPQKTLSHKFLARLTQIDYAREMAFVAVSEPTGELLGVSRFIADPDYVRAEYAIIVRSDLKGQGLGWELMRHLIDYAKASGIHEIFGSVLTLNTGMLKMCRELGFRIEHDREDLALCNVILDLRR
jgi:acetyltransferase